MAAGNGGSVLPPPSPRRPRPPPPFLAPRLTRCGPFGARLPSQGSRVEAAGSAARGGRLRAAGGRGAAGRGSRRPRDNAAAADLARAEDFVSLFKVAFCINSTIAVSVSVT
nr:translation initiation factor IF-2-like [Pongo abelii]